jgi:hypothetical protein
LATITACSSSSFTGGGGKKGAAKPSKPGDPNSDDGTGTSKTGDQDSEEILKNYPPGVQAQEQLYKIGAFKAGVDILWAIDNSGSMSNEIAQVGQNFNKFADHIRSAADLKVGLITCTGTISNGHCLDASAVSGSKVELLDVAVMSTNALAVMMSTQCPPDQTYVPDESGTSTAESKVCNYKAETSDFSGIKIALVEGFSSKAFGAMQNFFRQNTRKIFVVVTDDNAMGIKAKSFEDFSNKKFSTTGFDFYGFIGTSSSSCKVSKVGVEYQTLASGHHGKTYDICITDWSASFNELSKNIARAAQRTFTVDSSSTVKILDVFVNGTEKLSSDKYTVSGNAVTIDDSVLLDPGSTVRIVYQ